MKNRKEINPRYIVEEQFHEQLVKEHKQAGFGVYRLGALDHLHSYLDKLIGDVNELEVLDFGCGTGWMTVKLASRGARVSAFDISDGMVRATQKLVQKAGLEAYVDVQRMNGEELKYNSDFFDLVVGHAILHHTDIEKVKHQVRRVLKKRGRAIFSEPLGTNLAINLVRKLTPSKRSSLEKPLTFQDIENLGNVFSQMSHREFYFISLMSFFWHVIIRNDYAFKYTLNKLVALDEVVLKHIKFFRKYCWYSVIELIK